MWFAAKIEQNPELLIGIVSENDVLRIANEIDAANDEHILSRISFEIGLDGDSGEDPYNAPIREPMITMCFNILDEKYLLDQKDTPAKSKLEKVMKHLNGLEKLIKQKDVAEILIHSGQFTEEQIALLKVLTCAEKEGIFLPLYDLNAINKQRHERWGKSGYYKRYIKKAAHLYFELTGRSFTSDFTKSHYGEWQTATEGTRFVLGFNEILNRISKTYGGKAYSMSNFKTACDESRGQ